ncbi:MAG: hypothetical protein P8Y97_05265 [Candidatus Lokiarchaeota archaeon]
MLFGKKPIERATERFEKAEDLFEANQYRKSGKYFASAGEIFFEEKISFERAKESFFNAARSFLNDERFEDVLRCLRLAGNSALQEKDQILEANKFFTNSIEYITYLKDKEDRDYNYVLFSVLNYMCLFLKGKSEKGLNLLKKIKKRVDDSYFKESKLIHLITDFILAIRDNKLAYLEKVESNFNDYGELKEAEKKLIKNVIMVAKTSINIVPHLQIKEKQYTTNDVIDLHAEIKTDSLLDFKENSFYNYEIKSLKIIQIRLNLSDNLTSQNKVELPLDIEPGKTLNWDYKIKPHFLVEESRIGPIKMTCKIDDKFICYLDSNSVIKPNIISPPASLDVSIKNLRPPLIGKTFPLEIFIENNSDGEAADLDIVVEFPRELQVMRGTTEKNEEKKKFPFSIKL